jgi:phosphatidylinositol 4-kinase type 2
VRAGPLELTRRDKVLVWDDEIEVTDESLASAAIQSPESPQISINTMPLPRHARSHSLGARDFPPPMRRTSTELNRPVPFSAKFQRVHPATTGVTVLEHMERLDKVEASLKRLGSTEIEDVEAEADVGESSTPRAIAVPMMKSSSSQSSRTGTPLLSPRSAPLPVVQEVPSIPESLVEVDEPVDGPEEEPEPTEEDVAALSKSMSHMEISPSRLHTRWGSDRDPQAGPQGLDWMLQTEIEGARKRIAIVEVSMLRKNASRD